MIFLYILFRGELKKEIQTFGYSGFAVSIVGAMGTMAFIPAFKLTSVANVSIIYAAAPFFSAFIAWLWMRERPAKSVLIGSALVMVGVLTIVSGSSSKSNLTGDFLALFMTVVMAGVVCIYRRYPKTPARGPALMMALFLMPVGLLFDQPFALPLHEILLCLLFGLVFAVASVTLAEGARLLPAAQTSLLSTLEMPLAPIWAFFIFTEYPPLPTVFGGLLIAAAILGAQLSINNKAPS